jgi:DNA-directed RNA polymerase subunit RPC12/RpoP
LKTIFLTTSDTIHNAYFLKHKLENEGINVVLQNEHASNLIVWGPNIKADGIQLFVLEKDFAHARQVLGYEAPAAVKCPRCGSENLKSYLRRNAARLLLALLSSYFHNLFTGKQKHYLQCHDCGIRF